MKKFFGFLIAILILLGVIFFLFKAQLFSSYLSNKLDLNVSMSSISLSPSHLGVDEFTIKNALKAQEKDALAIGRIDAKYQWKELRADPSVVDEIILKDVHLVVECLDPICTSNNWTEMLSNGESDGEVIIKRLEIQNLTVDIYGLGVAPGAKKTFTKSNIVFNNVSSKEGFPKTQILSEILKSVGMEKIFEAIENPKDMIEDVLSPFGGLGEKEAPLKKMIETSTR